MVGKLNLKNLRARLTAQGDELCKILQERDGLYTEAQAQAVRIEQLEAERDELRAQLTELERQEPVAWVLRSAAKRPQPAVVTQKKYLSCAISDLVDKGLEHLDPLFYRPVPAQAVPDGWRLVKVKSAEFDSLMYWLDRCESKGHLGRCADLIQPWAEFAYEDITAPEHKA